MCICSLSFISVKSLHMKIVDSQLLTFVSIYFSNRLNFVRSVAKHDY